MQEILFVDFLWLNIYITYWYNKNKLIKTNKIVSIKYLQELFYFLVGITRKLEDLTYLEYFPIKLVEKCILICYDKSVITDPAISVKEIDGKPYYFNERYPGYKRDLVEFAIGMCILEIDYQSREEVRLHPIVDRIIRRGHTFLSPTHHAEMHSREIEELVKSFSKCGWRVTNFLQVLRFRHLF